MSTRVVHRARRALACLLAVAVLAGLMVAGTMLYLRSQLDEINRIDGVFDDLPTRPARPTSGAAADAMNLLLIGTDRRSAAATTGTDATRASWVPGAQRSDALMLVHIDADRENVTVVSLPRDSWVDVPGIGPSKINSAFSYGGPRLAVQTVERLTGVHIDHLAIIDWEGFRELTDAVGGVDVQVPETVHDPVSGVTWTAGEHHLDGKQALDYVSQRYNLPGGDLDRVRRQQTVLATLAEESIAMRSSPQLALGFVGMLSRHVSVDADWSTQEMTSLAWSMRGLGRGDLHYLTAPVSGFGEEGEQSVVRLDAAAGERLWRALRKDAVDGWTETHPKGWYSDGPVP